jgi:hypothetical protein
MSAEHEIESDAKVARWRCEREPEDGDDRKRADGDDAERERRWNLSLKEINTAKAKKRKLNLLTRQQRHALRVLEDARHEQEKKAGDANKRLRNREAASTGEKKRKNR